MAIPVFSHDDEYDDDDCDVIVTARLLECAQEKARAWIYTLLMMIMMMIIIMMMMMMTHGGVHVLPNCQITSLPPGTLPKARHCKHKLLRLYWLTATIGLLP